ncbi:Signal transduction histidine kinase [Fervidobacterium changbaicum]|uniref:histidine kinase n=1 Tax=Fervidobacterium changbaicum TaxID=310769 RepID=A0ABX5QS86_9BACT|nr:HAMP domain-containing sensor histidine kinase [Fervidobacterium changbaicum]QAV33344.1 sensor histidine kinase [Fervidobacterium changbaicum]SDG89205.1 Signal transduction histidine kinase [Fervidobacterium changbaicum]
MKIKSLKHQFYLLVFKIMFFTFLSSFVVYLAFVLPLYRGIVRPTDYYVRYLDEIEKEIKKKSEQIINGKLINLSLFEKEIEEIEGEVIDINGKHLYGDFNIASKGIDYWKTFNRDFVKNGYIYRYVPVVKENRVEAIYVLRAPFSFFLNNKAKNQIFAFLYFPAIVSPIIFFIIYLLIFTRSLYLDVSKNMHKLLEAAEKVSKKDFNFTLEGMSGTEFLKIQDAFNEMISTIHSAFRSLWDLDNERRKMLASIAHDIKTPVTVIQGQAEIIDTLNPHPSVENSLKIIKNNCKRITNLANNISLLGKIEIPNPVVRKSRVNLKDILSEKEKEIKMMTLSKDVEVVFEINLSKDYYALDENLLLRLLDNILYNSLRFTQEGEIRLIVDDKDDAIHFLCLDTGVGFNEEDINNLFKAYYQGKDFKDHFGLGLYISKKIVDLFGGEIKAYNRVEGGAAVEFIIREMSEQ